MWHPTPDELALAALPAEPRPRGVETHLAECVACREQVEALRRTVDLVRAGDAERDGAPAAPPPGVWDAIVAELGDELGDEPADEPGDDRDRHVGPPPRPLPVVGPRPAAHPRRRPAWRQLAVAAVAALVGVALGLGIGVVAASSEARYPVAATPLAPLSPATPAASGEVRLVTDADGRELVVEVAEPGPRPEGGYLEAWLMDSAGTRLFALGALVPQDGDHYAGTFRIPDDLPIEEFDTVDVSVEHFDGNPDHSGKSVLRGRAS